MGILNIDFYIQRLKEIEDNYQRTKNPDMLKTIDINKRIIAALNGVEIPESKIFSIDDQVDLIMEQKEKDGEFKGMRGSKKGRVVRALNFSIRQQLLDQMAATTELTNI